VEMAAGGPAANAAVTAAALGAEVTLVTAVGAHPLGALIRADLKTHGVRLIDASPDSPAPPPLSSITVRNATGERTIVSRNAGDARVDVPPLPSADLTLVDGHHPALAVAAARGANRLLIDAGTWRPVFAEILPRAEVVACSAAFRHPAQTAPTDEALAAAIAARRGAARPVVRGPRGAAPHVLVTHGPSPVRWFTGDAHGEVPVPPIPAVDTSGAGDAFHGALAVALASGAATTPLPLPDKSDLSDLIAFAIRVAGVRVAHRGPRSWLAQLR
jgi:sugar/nucleoside kinase (ribokinase family)